MKVLVVEDHEVVREGLVGLLGADEAYDVVGAAASGEEALRLAVRTQPDVVLLDFRLPDMPGDQVCRSLHASVPGAVIVMLTSYESEGAVRGAMAAGARGYVSKSAGFVTLKRVIAEVADGADSHPVVALTEAGAGPQVEVSAQDRQLLELAAKGLSDREIARKLHLAESTVRFHLQKLKGRLDARSKTGLVAQAIRSGLIGLDDEGLIGS